MKKQLLLTLLVALWHSVDHDAGPGLQAAQLEKPSDQEDARHEHDKHFVPPAVFQAAGPTANSIQSTVDAFRAALGNPNNGNSPGPLTSGRREINWDGGGVNTTTAPVTPFDVFLNTRGGRFTTPGRGLSQATPSGLATLFNNPTYATIFGAFSPLRLFTPVGSNITEASFFIPGSNGNCPSNGEWLWCRFHRR